MGRPHRPVSKKKIVDHDVTKCSPRRLRVSYVRRARCMHGRRHWALQWPRVHVNLAISGGRGQASALRAIARFQGRKLGNTSQSPGSAMDAAAAEYWALCSEDHMLNLPIEHASMICKRACTSQPALEIGPGPLKDEDDPSCSDASILKLLR